MNHTSHILKEQEDAQDATEKDTTLIMNILYKYSTPIKTRTRNNKSAKFEHRESLETMNVTTAPNVQIIPAQKE